jgi:prefoldin subunit 5
MSRGFGSNNGNPNGRNGRDGHQHVRELCALYSSGSLSRDEIEQLNEHIHSCRECADLLREHSRMVRQLVPAFADEQEIELTTGFKAELAQGRSRLMTALANDAKSPDAAGPEMVPERLRASTRLQYALVCAFALVLVIGAAMGGYVVGIKGKKSVAPAQARPSTSVQMLAPAPVGVSTANEEKIRRLTGEINQLESELSLAKRSMKELEQAKAGETEVASRLAAENSRIKAERDELSRNFDNAQAKVTQISQDLDHVRGQLDDATLRNSGLSKTVEAFQTRLQGLNDTIAEQQRLLAADRDIRELMGARDLLLADVFDVDPNGRNKKPFGRIFYTKNKSLIFYAFDLDRQPGVQNAGAFQVWGARAADNGKGSAFNMGVFYMDNQAMRRWVLKFDDPKVLAQIDSVFVTVEPEGGSHRPSGKQLLFASLRGEPNHP